MRELYDSRSIPSGNGLGRKRQKPTSEHVPVALRHDPGGDPSKVVRLPIPVVTFAKRLAERTLGAGDINAFLDVEARWRASVPLMTSPASCGLPADTRGDQPRAKLTACSA